MPRTPEPWRRAACGLAVVLLVACTDGYPSQDVPPFEPDGMTQAERLGALAALGRPRGLDVRWRYTLDTACGLTVERKPRWQSAERTRVVLRGTEVALRNDADRGTFGVVASVPEGEVVLLHESRRRVDAMHAAALVRLLQRDCVEGPMA